MSLGQRLAHFAGERTAGGGDQIEVFGMRVALWPGLFLFNGDLIGRNGTISFLLQAFVILNAVGVGLFAG